MFRWESYVELTAEVGAGDEAAEGAVEVGCVPVWDDALEGESEGLGQF